MKKFLQNYPFSNPQIRLVEGFSKYDGVLGDQIDAPHKGIDYVLRYAEQFISFDVYSMHSGIAFQGISDSWGIFVIVHTQANKGFQYSTIFAHLDSISFPITQQSLEHDGRCIHNMEGTKIHAGQLLGRAGTSGWTKDIIQLHLEIHLKNITSNETVKIDPYGVNNRASSNRYPQPGSSLAGLPHLWTSNTPPFAS